MPFSKEVELPGEFLSPKVGFRIVDGEASLVTGARWTARHLQFQS